MSAIRFLSRWPVLLIVSLIATTGVAGVCAAADTDSGAGRRANVLQYAAGNPSRSALVQLRRLYLLHADAMLELADESVPQLPANQFQAVRVSDEHGLFAVGGRLQFPPELTSENPASSLMRAQVDLQASFDDAFETIARGAPITLESLDRLNRSIARLERFVDRRDPASVVFCAELRKFVRHSVRQPRHHTELVDSGLVAGTVRTRDPFPGGKVGDLLRYCFVNEVAPAIGSPASRHLVRVADALANAADAAEDARRDARLARAEQRSQLAATNRQNRANATAARLAQQPSDFSELGPYADPRTVPVWSYASSVPIYDYWSYWVPTYGTTTHRYVISY